MQDISCIVSSLSLCKQKDKIVYYLINKNCLTVLHYLSIDHAKKTPAFNRNISIASFYVNCHFPLSRGLHVQ